MDNQKFGAFVASTRRELGMSQRQLAQKLGVTDKAVSKWERGLGFPDIKTMEPLAQALGLSISELMQSRRLPDPLTAAEVDQAVGQVIDRALHQQKLERRNLTIGILLASLAVTLVFLLDALQAIGFVMVCLPILCGLAGIILVIAGLLRRNRNQPCKALLICGALLLLIPIAELLLLFLAMRLGGPVPS